MKTEREFADPVLRDIRVETCGVIVTTGLTNALECSFVDAEAVDDLEILSVEMALFLRKVTEG